MFITNVRSYSEVLLGGLEVEVVLWYATGALVNTSQTVTQVSMYRVYAGLSSGGASIASQGFRLYTAVNVSFQKRLLGLGLLCNFEQPVYRRSLHNQDIFEEYCMHGHAHTLQNDQSTHTTTQSRVYRAHQISSVNKSLASMKSLMMRTARTKQTINYDVERKLNVA